MPNCLVNLSHSFLAKFFRNLLYLAKLRKLQICCYAQFATYMRDMQGKVGVSTLNVMKIPTLQENTMIIK